MRKELSALTVFVIAALVLSSCAPRYQKPAVAMYDGEESPFILKVLDEVNDGSRLHVLGSVKAKSDWNSEEVVVRLLGMNGNKEKNHADYRLSRSIAGGKFIRAGQEVTFTLDLSSGDITDYQLELLWGAETSGIPAEVETVDDTAPAKASFADPGTAAPVKAKLEFLKRELVPVSLASGKNTFHYKIGGEVMNYTSLSLSQAILKVGFLWRPVDLILSVIPQLETASLGRARDVTLENTELLKVLGVPIEELEVALPGPIGPGERRPFSINLDQEVPMISGGSYVPVIRLAE